jgi:GT2 family glycosyltransferase
MLMPHRCYKRGKFPWGSVIFEVHRKMNVAVIVASTNRAEETGQLLRQLSVQSRKPCAVILSVTCDEDLPRDIRDFAGHGQGADMGCGRVIIIQGAKGLTLQRNRGLEVALPIADVVLFFDDDFLPAADTIMQVERLFSEHENIVGATGQVILDGVTVGGISHDEAMAALRRFEQAPRKKPVVNKCTDEVYGCNMAFRSSAVGKIRFDETLPLYGWQEDVDFAGQLLAKGEIVKTTAFSGVHRGVNKGRSPGFSLGFSQMVNPIYLTKKGTMRPLKAATIITKNFLANHAKCIWPESYVDRAGRMRGNWRGILHLAAGRADPTAVLDFGIPKKRGN